MSRSPVVLKAAVLAGLRAQLEADLDAVTESQKRTQEGATHEEARPESDKDTRATESSYLARGLAKRVSELRNVLSQLANFSPRRFGDDDEIGLGALVTCDNEAGDPERFFLAPAGGGARIVVGEVAVSVITPESPLARALLGKTTGDEVELRTARATRTLEIASVS